MKCFKILFVLLLLLGFSTICKAEARWPAAFDYLHPVPNSQLVSDSTTIITRLHNDAQLDLPDQVQFQVRGSRSGLHSGETILSEDSKTFIFKPDNVFATPETVYVDIQVPSLNVSHSYSFVTSSRPSRRTAALLREWNAEVNNVEATVQSSDSVINGVAVPANFPRFRASINVNPAPGKLFVAAWNWLIIFQNDGTPYFFRESNSHVWDFTVQPNGLLSYMDGATAKVMNEHFEIIRKYKCRHGYVTDPHEFQMLPNGHVLLIAQDTQVLDLSKVIEGGRTNANVVGTHIQELDTDKNVVFEWRCWDNYRIADAQNVALNSQTVHYVHMNAVDVDYDGNILVSARHLNEITKIDRNTGDIIWRLGGVNNQFDFVNDPDRFDYQHHIRAVPNSPNHYTLLDNGNNHSPHYSRAVEYAVDEAQKTATKVWEYRPNPDVFTHWMGSVQRLPNGNTLIGWAHEKLPKVTEVSPGGQVVYQGNYVYAETSYRSHRFEWSGCANQPEAFIESKPDRVRLMFNQYGDCPIQKYYIYADTLAMPTTRIDSTTNTVIDITELEGRKTYYFRVTSLDSSGNESDFSNQVEAFVRFVTPESNLLDNGNFSQGFENWQFEARDSMATATVEPDGRLHIKIDYSNNDPDDVILYQPNIPLFELKSYRLQFDASASTNRLMQVQLSDSLGRYDYSMLGLMSVLRHERHYEYDFLMDDYSDSRARLQFALGDKAGDVYIDNIALVQVEVTDVAEKETGLPHQFCVLQNYPNPFNASTTISYQLPSAAQVTIGVFDVLGRSVLQHTESLSAGSHTFRWDALDQSTGLYFCRIQTKDKAGRQASETIKLLLVK